MSAAKRSAAFAIGFVSHYGILITCGVPYWSQSNWQTSNALYGRIPTFNGIWWQCMSLKTGGFSCNNYGKPTIYVDADVQAFRALMCIACIFSFFGVLISLLGLDCTTLIEPETKAKAKTAFVAGTMFIVAASLQAQRALMVIAVILSFIGLVIGMASLRCTTMLDNATKWKSIIGITSGTCFLLTGICCGAAVSWYAWKVTMEYFHPFYQEREFKYEYGACLYIGWVSMLLGACVLIATIWYGVTVQQEFYDPANKNNSFKYEFGSCLYVGWVSGAITLVAGLILTVGSCRNLRSDKADKYTPYTYKPQATKAVGERTEYV